VAWRALDLPEDPLRVLADALGGVVRVTIERATLEDAAR